MDTEDIRNFVPPPMALGDGVKVERIPLPEDFVRLQALKAAVDSCAKGELSSRVIDRAHGFERYIRDGLEEGYHDENTMNKVYEALRENGFLPADIPGVISSFQNRGILFRERR